MKMPFVIIFITVSVFYVFRILYWDSNDWPEFLKEAHTTCIKQEKCKLDLRKIYVFTWDKVYFFDGGSEKGFIEKIIKKKLNNYHEFCQVIIITGEHGEIIEEKYSGCFEEFFSFNRQPLARIAVPETGYFVLSNFAPFLCVESIFVTKINDNYNYFGLDDSYRQKFYSLELCDNLPS